jgi:hypothetical protein
MFDWVLTTTWMLRLTIEMVRSQFADCLTIAKATNRTISKENYCSIDPKGPVAEPCGLRLHWHV